MYLNGSFVVNAITYKEDISLVSDANASLTAKHHGNWVDTRDVTFENGHHFNEGEYYIKQVYGVENFAKVLKSSVEDEKKPSSSATILESDLVPQNVKALIAKIWRRTLIK